MHLERRFNANQPRDADGQWSDGSPGVDVDIDPSRRRHAPAPPNERRLRSIDGSSVALSVDGGRMTVRFPAATTSAADGGDDFDFDRVTLDRQNTTELAEELELLEIDTRNHMKKQRAATARIEKASPGTPEHDAAMADWEKYGDRRILGGRFPGDPTDIAYEAHSTDDDEAYFSIAVRPPDADEDWTPYDAVGTAGQAAALLNEKQFYKLVKELRATLGDSTRSRTAPALIRRRPTIRPVARRGLAVPQLFHRSYPLDDIQISRSGDGRTVEAYAACFGTPYEVRDQHGHYLEVIDRSAFNRTLSGGAGKSAMCLYNHGMNVHGSPDGMASIPLGKPLEIRPDGRGLLTVTRYNKGPFADQVLEAIRNGDITAQSFRGRIVRSSPNGPVPRRRSGDLPTIVRHELGLTDYGPTPIPVNAGAEIVAVRSLADLMEAAAGLDEDERLELLRGLGVTLEATPDGDPAEDEQPDEGNDTATPDNSGPGAEDPPPTAALRSAADVRRRARVAMLTRGML